ncbi:hypothetical protein C8J43_102227 [Sphingomonas sp. PP-CE-1G-424]|nr:hypothetical protein C8J43_102227 [Sphingomonas sp. PP-CE-1G-424]
MASARIHGSVAHPAGAGFWGVTIIATIKAVARSRGASRPWAAVAAITAPIAALLLTACDGSDSASSPTVPTAPTPTPAPVNAPPVFTSANAVSVVENTTAIVYQAAATDPEGAPVAYAISGGVDAAKFTLNGTGQLGFVAPPNFGLPTDLDGNNVYLVQLTASDGQATSTIALQVTVTNSKEGIAVHRVATGFIHPVAIASLSATRMLVAERSGAIYDLNPQTGARTLFYQVANVGTGDRGMIALAVAPTFTTTGIFHVMFTNPNGFLIVQRYLRNQAGPTVPDNSGPLLAVSAPQYPGGGWLGYDAGNLIIATGDAGGAGDPAGSAQDSSSRLGKILRVTNNPDPYAGASPQFFLVSAIAKGLRNPNGGAYYSGGLLIADSGQDVAEEVDFLPLGAPVTNFGWPFKEGTKIVHGTPPADIVDPSIQYPHTGGTRFGQAIVGGFVGSPTIASLSGVYVFADRNGALFTTPADPLRRAGTIEGPMLERRNEDFAPDQGTIDRPVSFGVASDGQAYIVDDDGEIFSIDQG